jgi:hypothetical protein
MPWCNTLSSFSISRAGREVKLLGEIISVFSLQAKLLLHRWENGPGGIRTRICDLDRVLCCRCTTGPEQSLCNCVEDGKKVIGNFVICVPNWDE